MKKLMCLRVTVVMMALIALITVACRAEVGPKVQWQHLEVPLGPVASTKNILKLAIDLPCKPEVTVSGEKPAQRVDWTGQVFIPFFDYGLTVPTFTVNDKYDPKQLTDMMMERWKADTTNKFIKGSTLPVPLKDMKSSVIVADYRDPDGNVMTSIYGAMKIRDYAANIHLTYHSSEKVGMETAKAMLDSIKVISVPK